MNFEAGGCVARRLISPLTGFRIDMANDFLAPLER
jgi:hypothetical protein